MILHIIGSVKNEIFRFPNITFLTKTEMLQENVWASVKNVAYNTVDHFSDK